MMTGKEIVKLIITLVIGFILSSAFDRYKSVQSNNDSILISNERLEQFDKRITKLEDDNRKLGDVYVTRSFLVYNNWTINEFSRIYNIPIEKIQLINDMCKQ